MHLSHAALADLHDRGVTLSQHPSYGYEQAIHPEIRFEPPCVVQAEVGLAFPLSIGAFTGIYGTRGTIQLAHVGRYCSIAPGLQTGAHEHPMDRLTSSMAGYIPNVHGWGERFGVNLEEFARRAVPFHGSVRGLTVIGHDVWIGQGVFIRTGVRIGNGAIVGAGSVVLKDVPPYAVVAGNPARLIRSRFSDAVIERLERSRWWRFNLFDLPAERLADIPAILSWIEEAERAGRLVEYRPDPVPVLAPGVT